MIRTILELFLGYSCVVSCVYWLASTWLLRRRFRPSSADAEAAPTLPPVTFLRPLKSGVPDLEARLAEAAAVLRAGDQLVLGVDPDSPEWAACTRLAEQPSPGEIIVVPCGAGHAQNPKINKLVQMQRAVRCEHLVLMDSEAMLTTEWMHRFRAEWARGDAALLTAGYRFAGATRCLQQLDAAPVLLTLWPGLAYVEVAAGLWFALGACIALRRETLETAGGWSAYADHLAEDYALGQRIRQAGGKVMLSKEVLPLHADALGAAAYWRHQRRIAVTYRVANRTGFMSQVMTHGVTAAILLILLTEFALGAWILAGIVALVRIFTASAMSRVLAWPVPHLWLIAPLASLMESIVWAAAWCSRRIWWAGRWWSVSRSGELALSPGRANERFPTSRSLS